MNPFNDRICEVFSSSGDGDMTFEDFLDMMSVFSENAPKNVKVEYAFRIYGEMLSIPLICMVRSVSAAITTPAHTV